MGRDGSFRALELPGFSPSLLLALPGGHLHLPTHPASPSSRRPSFTASEESFYPPATIRRIAEDSDSPSCGQGPLPAQSLWSWAAQAAPTQISYSSREQREVPEKMDGGGSRLFATKEVASQVTRCPMHAMD